MNAERDHRNNKSQAPNTKTCPPVFGGKITKANDQNQTKQRCLEFVM
jgi:hypothetical protein